MGSTPWEVSGKSAQVLDRSRRELNPPLSAIAKTPNVYAGSRPLLLIFPFPYSWDLTSSAVPVGGEEFTSLSRPMEAALQIPKRT